MSLSIKSLFLFLCFAPISVLCQEKKAEEILAKSIEYHDPGGLLSSKNITMNFIETRPKGEDRKSSVRWNIKKRYFQMAREVDNLSINSFYKKGKVSILVNGKKKFSEEIAKKYRLNPGRIEMMKNYYQYLWMMPMKLNDPGTIIDPVVKEVDFFGKASFQIKVTYDPKVGKDIWYFYFHPTTNALIGYRFYHNESKNDGEYIILEDEVIQDGIKIPKSRTWYMHTDDKLLGTDILHSIVVE